jgi:vancomycin resistance protein YoaR
VQTFGNALGPLVAAAIKVMYLGVMGWISSLITIRGVTIMTHAPKPQVETAEPSQTVLQKTMPKAQKKKTKREKNTKPEAMQSEPEIIVIPPEGLGQQVQTRQKSHSKS